MTFGDRGGWSQDILPERLLRQKDSEVIVDFVRFQFSELFGRFGPGRGRAGDEQGKECDNIDSGVTHGMEFLVCEV